MVLISFVPGRYPVGFIVIIIIPLGLTVQIDPSCTAQEFSSTILLWFCVGAQFNCFHRYPNAEWRSTITIDDLMELHFYWLPWHVTTFLKLISSLICFSLPHSTTFLLVICHGLFNILSSLQNIFLWTLLRWTFVFSLLFILVVALVNYFSLLARTLFSDICPWIIENTVYFAMHCFGDICCTFAILLQITSISHFS